MSFSFNISRITFFLLLLSLESVAQEYSSRYFSMDQGLPQEYIYSIVQDENGYLWLGTGTGVARFDGFDFHTFSIQDSLAGDFVTTSFSNSLGQYFGHMNGDISYYERGVFKKLVPNIEEKTAITHINQSPDGRAWASSFSGELILLSHKNKLPVYEVRDEKTFISTFHFLTTQDLLLGTTRGLFHARISATNEVEIIFHYKEIPPDKVQSIISRRETEDFYIATQNEGIYLISFKGANPKTSRIDNDIEAWMSNIQTIYEDSRKNLWVGTFGFGLIKATLNPKGELEIVQSSHSDNRDDIENVKAIFEDREENIWIGNYGEGLIQLTRKTIFTETFDAENYGNSVLAIASDKNNYWLGTPKGLIQIAKNDKSIVNFYSSEEFFQAEVTALFNKDEEDIFIGTSWNGVFKLNKNEGKIELVNYADGNLEKSVSTLTGSGDIIWIGTQKGVSEVNTTNGNIKWYTIRTAGLPHNYVNQLFLDSKSRLWIATSSSELCYLINGEMKKLIIPASNGGSVIYSLSEDLNNNIWAGTQGGGIYFIQQDSIMNLTQKEGLFSDYCYALAHDKKGFIWIGHRNGYSKVNVNTLSIKAISRINADNIDFDFNKNASHSDAEGVLYLGHNAGMLRYHPDRESLKFPPPKLNISAIRVNNINYPVADRIVLKPGRYKIQFEFIGISHKAPELVQYQYLLEGYDDDWSEISSVNEATFPRLSEGRFTFRVNASSGDGVITDSPTEVTIVIKAPVWKQAWFYALVSIIVILLIYGYIKRREYKLTKEKRVLEQKVQERTIEIENQKNEIQKQRDLIELKNKDITDSIKYASRIQSAIIPPPDLLNKYFPEHFIINKPRDIVSGDFIWFAEKNDKIVVTVTDCTGHGVPGAIMSMLGISSLNEIVNNHKVLKANKILEQLREKVITSLNQQNLNYPTYDGMSLSLCVIDKDKKTLEYAGAYNNLLYYTNYEQKILYADRIPIGVSYHNEKNYKTQKIILQPGDIIYMYSDGYQDQFGGENDKKFTSRRLKNTFFTVHQLPMADQKQILEETLSDWMNGHEQTDDITIMGIRF